MKKGIISAAVLGSFLFGQYIKDLEYKNLAKIPENAAQIIIKHIKHKEPSIDDIISEEVRRHNRQYGAYPVSKKLIKDVIRAESNYEVCATSPKGAKGLMQLMPGTSEELGVKDIYDPRENIKGGIQYLGKQLKRFNGNLELALAAYNAGPERVLEADNKVPNIPETKDYVKKILGSSPWRMAGVGSNDGKIVETKPETMEEGVAMAANNYAEKRNSVGKEYVSYKVKKGENGFRILLKHGVWNEQNYDKFAKLNPNINIDKIKTGMVLRIPRKG